MAMNPMGGIDQQITQRAARMKNDPNALMQQYGQSKNILDLIAAQRAAEKVQKEKQLAALQMQGNPPTVADQLEQTLIASEKEKMAPDLAGMKNLRDRTKGVAGVLAQKQRQQQQRMQQMGQQPQQRPQGLPSQPAPNLERMYGGGIVGFEEGVYIPTEEDIDAVIRERGLRSATRESVRNMLIREQKLAKQREAVGGFFSGIGERALRQRAARQEAIGEAPARGIRPTRPEEVIETESVTEVMPTGGVDLAAQRRSQDLTDAVNAEQRQMAAAREPDVAAAAAAGQPPAPVETDEITMEEIVRMAGGAPQAQAPAPATPRQAAPTSTAPIPDFLLNREEQGRRRIAEIGDNAMAAGISGLPTGPLKTLERGTQAPELLRRSAVTPLTLEQRYEALERKRLEDLEKDETALTDTRSNTRRLLDRLTDAAINASKRPAATSNRGALASFGLGISEAVRAEEKERKEGLAGIRERRNALLKAKQDRELAKAQISQGERGLDIQQQRADTTAEQVAGMLGINESRLKLDAERLGMDAERYAATIEQAGRQFDQSMAFKILDANAQNRYRKQTAELKGQELALQREMLEAKTDAQKSDVQSKVVTAISEVNSNAQKSIEDARQAINLSTNLTSAEKTRQFEEAKRTINGDKQTLINALKGIGSSSGLDLSGLGAAPPVDVVADARERAAAR
jgi:hypothetical protein